MTDRSIVGFSANTERPSRTSDLLRAMAQAAGAALSASTEVFDLFEIDQSLRAAPFRTALEGPALKALSAVEKADALIVGAPTTTAGSYPGLLMHFFDLVDPALIRGKPVLVVATGSLGVNPRLVKLQLRLLFRVLGARPVPTAIYADKSELRQTTLDAALKDRIALANAELARMLVGTRHKQDAVPTESNEPDEPVAIWQAPAIAEAWPPAAHGLRRAAGGDRPRLSVVR